MPTIENWSPQSSASHPRQHGSPGVLDSGSRRMYSSTNNLIQSPESSASFITFRRGGSLTNSQRAASQHSQQVAPTSILQHTVVPNMQSSSSAVRGSSTSSGKLLHGDGSVSSVDTVEMVQVLLQSSLQVGGNGAVRFSPIVAAETSNSGLHPLSGSLEAPMAPLYSSTPTASNIQQSPWTVLTTSGSVIAPKGKLHSDEQYRCVDNDNDDLVVYRGMILLGWLQVLKLLGTGTFGQVFLCRDLRQLHPFHPPEDDVANGFFGESSSINSANSLRTARRLAASAQGAADTSHQPDWGGEDFQYFQCAGTFLPDGDLKQWPQSPRLVAVKVVKAIPSYELQSTLEAEILVRASEASIASGHSPNLHMSHPLCHLDGVNLTSTVNTSS
ncbi:protein kinase, putative, partial [Bodo saltans]